MSTGKVLLGVLAGVAIGALAGVLLAPEKGSVTRKKILAKGEDYADALREKFEEYMDDISERIDTVEGEEYANSLKQKFEEFLESISDTFHEVKEDISDWTEEKKVKTGRSKSDAKTSNA